MNTQDWNGCYDGSWQSAPLVADAYAHPAKEDVLFVRRPL